MSRRSRLNQAQTNAFLKYAPQDDVLKEAIRQAYANRHTAVRQAHGQARGVIGAVNDTLPAARHIYRDQAAQQATAKAIYGDDIAGLSGVAGSIQAGAALERQNATDSMSQARSATLTGLTQQRVAAKAGEQFATQKARADFVSDIKDVLRQKQSLAAQRGAFTASEIARLAEDAASRRVDLRKLSETVRHNQASEGTAQQNADTAAQNAADKGNGKNKPKLTTSQRNDGLDSITAARDQYAQAQGEDGFHPELLRKGLQVGGLPGADGKTVKIPTVKSNLQITAGFMLAHFGYIKPNVAKELRRRGYRIPKAWLKKPAPSHSLIGGIVETVTS